MNNRIMAMLFALVAAMFISIVPVKAEAACAHADTNKDCVCDYCKQENLHNWTYEKTETTHEKKCANPNCHFTDGAKPHTLTVKNNGDGTHTATCDCGYSKTDAHKDYNGDHYCDDSCGAVIHKMSFVEAKPAKCGLGGQVEHYHCAACGGNFEDVYGNARITDITTNPLEHKYVVKYNDGKHWDYCELCKAEGTKTAHELEKVINADGTHTISCKKCDFVKTEAHYDNDKTCKCDVCYTELEHKPGKPITNNGTEDEHVIKCEVCKKLLETEKCNFVYTAVEYGKGSHKVECSECGRFNTSEACYDKMDDHYCDKCGGHMVHDPLNTTYMTRKAKDPTCEEAGIDLHYECRVCGLLLHENGKLFTGDTVLPALGHKLDESWAWAETEDGTGHFKMCANGCNKTVYGTAENVQVGVETHSHKSWNKSDDAHEELCAVCGVYYGYEKHSYTKAELANASSTGTQRHKLVCECGASVLKKCVFDENCICKICGAAKVHNWDDLAGLGGTAATCTSTGKEFAAQCPNCRGLFQKDTYGKIIAITEADRVIPALGHKWVKDRQDVADGRHIMKCANEGCDKGTVMSHYTNDGDCYCDVEGCTEVAHSHKLIFVPAKEATCTESGCAAYYKYEACGKMFDMFQNEIQAPVVTEAAGHDVTDNWTPGENGMHVKVCADCGEAVYEAEHDFSAGSVCPDCGAYERLTRVPAVAATCYNTGNIEYWVAANGDKYADPDGITKLDPGDEVVAKREHKLVWKAMADGKRHQQVCLYEDCTYQPVIENHVVGEGCYCSVCYSAIAGHERKFHAMERATCAEVGHEAYYECEACDKLYDMAGNVITAPKTIAKVDHDFEGAKMQIDSGKHYVKCNKCSYRLYEDHAKVLEDPKKGNYHQWLCKCGEVEIEPHIDNNGDKVCDVCGNNSDGKTVTVEQHDNVTVKTGEKETVNPIKTWWENWQNQLTGSNSGGTSSTNETPKGNSSTTKTEDKAPATNDKTPVTDNKVPETENKVPETQAPEVGSSAPVVNTPVATAPSGIMQFITWFLGLFGL